MNAFRALAVLGCSIAVSTALACGDTNEDETELAARGDGGRAGATVKGGSDLPGGNGGSAGKTGGGSAPAGTAGSGPATGGGAGAGAGQNVAGQGGSDDEADGGEGGSSPGTAGAAGQAAAGAAGAPAGTAGSGGSEPAHPVPECAYASVNTPGTTLNVRPDPSTNGAVIAVLPDNTPVDVLEKVDGQAVDGSPVWYKIKGGGTEGYAYGKFIECSATKPPDPPPLDGYYLPLACGMKVKCTQGNKGTVSHAGSIQYAFDFGVALNTPIRAAAPGTVTHIYNSTVPGGKCYNGGGSECSAYSNYVVVRHADNTQTIYKHLNRVDVAIGAVVARGGQLGLSGTTGYSFGPHIHIMHQNAGAYNAASIPLTFSDAGVPTTGQYVTSGNCP